MHVMEQIQMQNGYIGKTKIYREQGAQRTKIITAIAPEMIFNNLAKFRCDPMEILI